MMSALGSLGTFGAVAFHIIAVHEATERQRQVAEQQARFAYSQMPTAQRAVRRQRYIAVATVREPTSNLDPFLDCSAKSLPRVGY
jgi:hypothetical protein